MADCVYWGIFFDDEALPEPKLANPIAHKHVTCGFRKPVPDELVGQKCLVGVTGYANDGRNEAVSVRFKPWDEDLESAYSGADQKHITLSVADGAKPVDSGNLKFELPDDGYCNKQGEFACVFGRVGYLDFDGEIKFEVV